MGTKNVVDMLDYPVSNLSFGFFSLILRYFLWSKSHFFARK